MIEKIAVLADSGSDLSIVKKIYRSLFYRLEL